ncbi:MAG: 16S rRNA (cytidine(1402)-2'-O)-methyltransferase [Azospirillaceae bacterium]
MATPIGNAADITLRALDTLRRADRIACEDTRVTAKLLARHGIRRPLTAYHEHNAERARPALLAAIRKGEAVALVSDAGTPLVSDPGFKLVREARSEGLAVTTLPGPVAAIAALTLSGLPSDRFLFAGFPPSRAGQRRAWYAALADTRATLLVYESAGRLAASLADAATGLGDREAAVAREITKLHEECRSGRLRALAGHYDAAGPPRGEVVLVIDGSPPPTDPGAADTTLDDALAQALASGLRLRDAVDAVATSLSLPRRRVYARALELRDGDG